MVVAAGVTPRLVAPAVTGTSGPPGAESTPRPPEKLKTSTEDSPSVMMAGSALISTSGPPRAKLSVAEVSDRPAALVTVQERVKTPKAAVLNVTTGPSAPAVITPPRALRVHR